jgi:hypothetical protein
MPGGDLLNDQRNRAKTRRMRLWESIGGTTMTEISGKFLTVELAASSRCNGATQLVSLATRRTARTLSAALIFGLLATLEASV